MFWKKKERVSIMTVAVTVGSDKHEFKSVNQFGLDWECGSTWIRVKQCLDFKSDGWYVVVAEIHGEVKSVIGVPAVVQMP